VAIADLHIAPATAADSGDEDIIMTIGTAMPSVFDAGLPTLSYDVTESPHDVYPRIRAAQALAPIAIGPLGPEVLSYNLARAILRDPRFVIPPGIHLTAHGVTLGELWDRVVRSILCMEGAEHRRLRGFVSRAFTPRATGRMDETIHAVINELADAVVAEGNCEFVEAIARPYPIPVICALLGAPRQDWQLFSKWAEDIFKIVSFDCNLAEEEPTVLKAWDAFDVYIDGMIADRRKTLTDDLLSELIRAEDRGDRLDAGEVRMLAFSILLAGTDTTRTQLAASMQVLCEHPEQWALLRDKPELGMKAVEETMRHSPSMCSTLRSVTDDVTVGDYAFPAGTFIIVNTYAANRDPAIYDDPTRFDITRNDPPAILTFGGGAHYCLGANLARRELSEALKILAHRLPNLRCIENPPWRPLLGMSGPTSLHIEFETS
jgi:cytochrome P450